MGSRSMSSIGNPSPAPNLSEKPGVATSYGHSKTMPPVFRKDFRLRRAGSSSCINPGIHTHFTPGRLHPLCTLLLSLVCILLLVSCRRQTASLPQTVLALQQLDDLATVEYELVKVVKADDSGEWFKIGDRKMLFTIHAHAKAGIKLSSITEENVQVDGKSITLRLPQPRILSISIPPEQVSVAFESVTGLRSGFTEKERISLLKQAETDVREKLIETGILDQARVNTQTVLARMLKNLGYEQIRINYLGSEPVIINSPSNAR